MVVGKYESAQDYVVIGRVRSEDLVLDRAFMSRLKDVLLWEKDCDRSDKIVLRS